MRFPHLFVGPLLLLALTACEVTFLSISTDGRLRITVETNGDALDFHGYSVAVDGGQVHALDMNGAVTLTDLSQGSHTVQLSGFADNCAVQGENPRTIVVPSAGTLSLAFVVGCRPKRTLS
ncbi:MAG TPA: hypothetical protein VH763_17715 [Gemmatimonadales bacterium]|jgi:hypothetical protein